MYLDGGGHRTLGIDATDFSCSSLSIPTCSPEFGLLYAESYSFDEVGLLSDIKKLAMGPFKKCALDRRSALIMRCQNIDRYEPPGEHCSKTYD